MPTLDWMEALASVALKLRKARDAETGVTLTAPEVGILIDVILGATRQ